MVRKGLVILQEAKKKHEEKIDESFFGKVSCVRSMFGWRVPCVVGMIGCSVRVEMVHGLREGETETGRGREQQEIVERSYRGIRKSVI